MGMKTGALRVYLFVCPCAWDGGFCLFGCRAATSAHIAALFSLRELRARRLKTKKVVLLRLLFPLWLRFESLLLSSLREKVERPEKKKREVFKAEVKRVYYVCARLLYSNFGYSLFVHDVALLNRIIISF